MKTQGKDSKMLSLFGIVGVVILILIVVYALVIFTTINQPEERGTFGDMFGAINALFTGFAFAGVIVTILMQQKELKLQREEMKLQREEMKAMRNQHTVSRTNEIIRSQLTYFNDQISSFRLDTSGAGGPGLHKMRFDGLHGLEEWTNKMLVKHAGQPMLIKDNEADLRKITLGIIPVFTVVFHFLENSDIDDTAIWDLKIAFALNIGEGHLRWTDALIQFAEHPHPDHRGKKFPWINSKLSELKQIKEFISSVHKTVRSVQGNRI